jgi:hypothetical protein
LKILNHGINLTINSEIHAMILRFLLFWVPMPLIAILNAGIREKIFTKIFKDLICHQLSTLTLMILLKGRVWGIFILFILILPYLIYSIKN